MPGARRHLGALSMLAPKAMNSRGASEEGSRSRIHLYRRRGKNRIDLHGAAFAMDQELLPQSDHRRIEWRSSKLGDNQKTFRMIIQCISEIQKYGWILLASE